MGRMVSVRDPSAPAIRLVLSLEQIWGSRPDGQRPG
jgi:hypothetical protein